MKGAILLAAVLVAVALGACRREEYHEPMKLGAGTVTTEQAAR
ncbi:MAG: hypothetical protein AB7L90_00210 [Hyphomicrobiaceae bacterium]